MSGGLKAMRTNDHAEIASERALIDFVVREARLLDDKRYAE